MCAVGLEAAREATGAHRNANATTPATVVHRKTEPRQTPAIRIRGATLAQARATTLRGRRIKDLSTKGLPLRRSTLCPKAVKGIHMRGQPTALLRSPGMDHSLRDLHQVMAHHHHPSPAVMDCRLQNILGLHRERWADILAIARRQIIVLHLQLAERRLLVMAIMLVSRHTVVSRQRVHRATDLRSVLVDYHTVRAGHWRMVRRHMVGHHNMGGGLVAVHTLGRRRTGGLRLSVLSKLALAHPPAQDMGFHHLMGHRHSLHLPKDMATHLTDMGLCPGMTHKCQVMGHHRPDLDLQEAHPLLAHPAAYFQHTGPRRVTDHHQLMVRHLVGMVLHLVQALRQVMEFRQDQFVQVDLRAELIQTDKLVGLRALTRCMALVS